MKFISAAIIFSAIATVSALVTPVAAEAGESIGQAPFVTLVDAPTGLTRDDLDALHAAIAAANITPADESSKATTYALYACSGPSFGGMCRWLVYDSLNSCNNVPSWFADTITSMDVFFTGVQCMIYDGYTCSVDIMGPVTY
ncbi:hypothetical protein BDV98DRAFT_608110, partial [Pterulicium gracile]